MSSGPQILSSIWVAMQFTLRAFDRVFVPAHDPSAIRRLASNR